MGKRRVEYPAIAEAGRRALAEMYVPKEFQERKNKTMKITVKITDNEAMKIIQDNVENNVSFDGDVVNNLDDVTCVRVNGGFEVTLAERTSEKKLVKKV